jgi:hypothetical protein
VTCLCGIERNICLSRITSCNVMEQGFFKRGNESLSS